MRHGMRCAQECGKQGHSYNNTQWSFFLFVCVSQVALLLRNCSQNNATCWASMRRMRSWGTLPSPLTALECTLCLSVFCVRFLRIGQKERTLLIWYLSPCHHFGNVVLATRLFYVLSQNPWITWSYLHCKTEAELRSTRHRSSSRPRSDLICGIIESGFWKLFPPTFCHGVPCHRSHTDTHTLCPKLLAGRGCYNTNTKQLSLFRWHFTRSVSVVNVSWRII